MSIYNDSIYYVYFYLRKDYTPYYVGKGKDKRAYSLQHDINLPKDKSRIIIIHDNLTELQSLIIERYYIRWFGRKDIGTGILRNRTDGGDGVSGLIHSEESRKQMSIKHTGKTIPKETGIKISKALKGRSKPPRSKTHCDNMALAFAKHWIVIDPNGNESHIINLEKFCKENNLTRPCMNRVADGIDSHHKGWKCKRDYGVYNEKS
jgi:hypothetical protein